LLHAARPRGLQVVQTHASETERAKISIWQGALAMEITISLSHFVDYLDEVKQKRRTWLDETDCLVDNFRFDNESATYDPQPEPALNIGLCLWLIAILHKLT
jgi:hypothetical protein